MYFCNLLLIFEETPTQKYFQYVLMQLIEYQPSYLPRPQFIKS